VDRPPPPDITESAIALITAHLAGADAEVMAEILFDVDPDDMALHLAWLAAYMIRTTTGGQAWLQRYGLEAAGRREA
jgi:hypothetical protein